MTTRAVHLEMCHDLSSDATRTTLRRFFARRGTLSNIYTSRKITDDHLRQFLDEPTFLDNTRLPGNSTPPMHHILMASVNVSFVASKTLYTPPLDLKPSQIIQSTPCCARVNSFRMHDPSRLYCLLHCDIEALTPNNSFAEECLPVCLQKIVISH